MEKRKFTFLNKGGGILMLISSILDIFSLNFFGFVYVVVFWNDGLIKKNGRS